MAEIYELELQAHEDLTDKLFIVYRDQEIHFRVGTTASSLQPVLYSTYPLDDKTSQLIDVNGTTIWNHIPWEAPNGSGSVGNTIWGQYARLVIKQAGCWLFHLTLNGEPPCVDKKSNFTHIYLLVPVGPPPGALSSSNNAEKIDNVPQLDNVRLLTFLAKSLGTLDHWEDRLQIAYETGYNMIHITPLQELGYSRSSYSLRDQVKLNPELGNSWEDMFALLSRLREQWNIRFMTDLVYNHTANDSPWLKDHPESSYNLVNSPHLRPAYLLDRLVWNLTVASINGEDGLTSCLTNEHQLQILASVMREGLVKLRLHEFFQCNVDCTIEHFREYLLSRPTEVENLSNQQLVLTLDSQYRRLCASMNFETAYRLFMKDNNNVDDACAKLMHALEELNDGYRRTVEGHLEQAVTNVMANARYRFVDEHGLRLGRVTLMEPLMWTYFVELSSSTRTLEDAEDAMNDPLKACFIMAHNGWVMGDNPLRNFAEPGSNVYLRRELIVWGDSVKLRYGSCPEDSPFLWQHMLTYTSMAARAFDAIRLDNCHSTPLHVAQYMLMHARAVRPDLYVVAELFTGSDRLDNIFINTLGINSLIREALSASDSHEQGRLVYRFGRRPIGAFERDHKSSLMPSVAHALLCDQTHDNPCPIEKRSARDLLASSALVAAAMCATGSNRGYDEMVPHHINVVTEERPYTCWREFGDEPLRVGILAGKRALNLLHHRLVVEGYTETFVDQMSPHVVAVTRGKPDTHESVLFVVYTCFSSHVAHESAPVPSLEVEGCVLKVLLELRTQEVTASQGNHSFCQSPHVINGLTNFTSTVLEDVDIEHANIVRATPLLRDATHECVQLQFPGMRPGDVVVLKMGLGNHANAELDKVRDGMASVAHSIELLAQRNALSLSALNRALFRCAAEERAEDGRGPYDVPGYGPLVYCGVQGVVNVLDRLRCTDDLGHPLCDNMRQGNWLLEYQLSRLFAHHETRDLAELLDAPFKAIGQLPRFLVPRYVDSFLRRVAAALRRVALNRLWPNQEAPSGCRLDEVLRLASVMFVGQCRNARLPPLAPQLMECDADMLAVSALSMSAGFPHFAEGIFRNWGRDTFISMRGLLLLTGRYSEARALLLAYAGTIRHGLVPNLLGGGLAARYNCRDAVWWWLQAVNDYCTAFPAGETQLLESDVLRLYPRDDSPSAICVEQIYDGGHTVVQKLSDVIAEVLTRQAEGVDFVERHAGPQLDEHMCPEGFRVSNGLGTRYPFPSGGSSLNCGTWMDKMGSSEKAGNRGRPATPRDGAAVELAGLAASVASWAVQLQERALLPPMHFEVRNGVAAQSHAATSLTDWAAALRSQLDLSFYVPLDCPMEELLHCRGAYRDTLGAQEVWRDGQLRPNFLVLLVLAPQECIVTEHACSALQVARNKLVGPLGMRTLSVDDWAYRAHYDNSNSSSDPSIAHGFNYHQGPEWLWLMGYYLRAVLRWQPFSDTLIHVESLLSAQLSTIFKSDWRALPELTNAGGEMCVHSCPAQAWSMACLLEALYDLQCFKKKQ